MGWLYGPSKEIKELGPYMHQFFVEKNQIQQGFITLTGEDVTHIGTVLRMKTGEQIRISDQEGADYFCALEEIGRDRVVARILYQDRASRELPVKITLFQGLPKCDKMEWIIQKAVELGAFEIVPVAMRNCVVQLDEKKAKSKVTRWQAIAEGAAKQSKRSIIPQVHSVMTFSQALDYAKTMDACFIPYENAKGMDYTREVIGSLGEEKSQAVTLGPEGGFDPKEIEAAQDFSKLLTLGNRILRTETAGMVFLSFLLYHLERDGEA